MLIICIAGMPGSGKGVVSEAARRVGLPVYVMGDVVREEAARRGLEFTPENLSMVASKLREEEGPAAVARRVAEKMVGSGSDVVVVDGVRSLYEVEELSRIGRVVIVAVHASPRTRFERIRRRGRPGDPRTWEEFRERDLVELGFGLGSVIALADYMLVNEGGREEAYREARRILEEAVSHAQDKG